ncbi:hypothetical protein CK203_113579 [Vitis vinifera]|uniref:Reverse transcriptase zinc-binding domain-containing protein n=1 Tax=Vitis vinifera TaxID=29760 RepID=A0A438D1D9_VITVI|nr:hypothetical protein CK203_113579 [Vitis vinifera]
MVRGWGDFSKESRSFKKWFWRYLRESSALWHQVILSIYGTHSNGWDANSLVRWSHRCPWKVIAQVFQDFSKYTRFVVGDGKEFVLGRLVVGDQPLGFQYPRLFRVVTDKNIPISSILGSARPFSWNFNFRRNLSDSEIKDLESLMRLFDCLHLSSSVSMREILVFIFFRVIYSQVFFLALSHLSDLSPVFPTKFVWNSQVSFKVKSFVWLVAHKKLAKMDWVPVRNISDMMFINYKGFGISKRGIVLWQTACIA